MTLSRVIVCVVPPSLSLIVNCIVPMPSDRVLADTIFDSDSS